MDNYFKDTNSNKYILQSVLNSTRILDLFFDYEEINATEVSRLLNIGKSTAFRLLTTLEYSGYLIKTNTSSYQLSLKFYILGKLVKDKYGFTNIIRPFLVELTNKTQETSHFVIWDDDYNVVFLDKVDGQFTIRMDSKIGLKRLAHITATGKVILAFSDEEFQDKYISQVKFEKYTENTLITPKDLKENLNKIRIDGFAYDNQESEVGLCCFAAPIFYKNKIFGAVSTSGPCERMKSKQEFLINEVKKIAEEITKNISY